MSISQDTLRAALIEYADTRDQMYRAAQQDDWPEFDRAAGKCRKVTELLWDWGRELSMEKKC